MTTDFTKQDILLIYGHFKKLLNKVEEVNKMKNPPIDRKNLRAEINQYSSIIEKILEANPEIKLLEDNWK